MTNYNWSNSPGVQIGSSGVYTVPGSTGGVLSEQMVYALARDAGFSEADAVSAVAIAHRESSFRSNILSVPGETKDYSVGLWQNNYINTAIGTGREQGWPDAAGLASNPLAQAQAAYQLFHAAGNSFIPDWAAIPGQYVAEAQQVANQVEASGNMGQLVLQAQAIGNGSATGIDSQSATDGSSGSSSVGSVGSAVGSGGSVNVGSVGSALGGGSSSTPTKAGGWNPITGLVNVHIPFGLAWATLFLIGSAALIIVGIWLYFGHPLPNMVPIPV